MFVYIPVGSSSLQISLSFANISSSFIDGFLAVRRLVPEALLIVSAIAEGLGLSTMVVFSDSLSLGDDFVRGGDFGAALMVVSVGMDLGRVGGLCDSTEFSLLLVEDDGVVDEGRFAARFPVSSIEYLQVG
jgi:hypothetical protein